MKNDSFDKIYKSYFEDIKRYLLSLCHDHHKAEDILQETFFRAYLYFEDCNSENIKGWLYKVAYHAFVDITRKQKNAVLKDDSFFSNIPGDKTPEGELLKKERLNKIGLHISALPEKQKQALVLHDFSGLSYEEAAQVMEVTLGYYKILLYRARQAIRMKEGY